MFTLLSQTTNGRRGILSTAHGDIQTPFFMPVATAGAMKGITNDQLLELGAQIALCNTYHLHLQPGEKIIQQAGGLHDFIHWKKPILTDSGGFQVFSFGKKGRTQVDDRGVQFQSHIDGAELFIGPEESIRIQHALGADIIMVFDECSPSTASRKEIEKAVDRTLLWAKKSKEVHEKLCVEKNKSIKNKEVENRNKPLLFGIVQGGLQRDLREKCAEELIAIGFDGYAIGGVAVGEAEEDMYAVAKAVAPLLPKDKARYLMGVGGREQLRQCVAYGIDMFDCVAPMRTARHGSLLLSDGSTIAIENAQYREDHSILDPSSPSPLSQVHRKSYLHHLFRAKERLAETIACMQNLGVTLEVMKDLRKCIEFGEAKEA